MSTDNKIVPANYVGAVEHLGYILIIDISVTTQVEFYVICECDDLAYHVDTTFNRIEDVQICISKAVKTFEKAARVKTAKINQLGAYALAIGMQGEKEIVGPRPRLSPNIIHGNAKDTFDENDEDSIHAK